MAEKTTTDCMRTLRNADEQLVIQLPTGEEIVIRLCKGGSKSITRLQLTGPKSVTYQTLPREPPPKIPISLPEI